MQTALYAHLIDADLAQLGRESPAALTQRFTTDFAFIKEALTRLSTVFLREVATILALIAAMLWIDPVLTLVAALVGPFIAHPIARLGQKLKRVATRTQEQVGEMASLISESLAGARVAKTYALEGYLKGRVAAAFDEIRRLKMKAANARGRLDPLLEAGGGVAVAAVLILIGWRILDGRSTVGDFTGFVSALILASQPIRALGNLNAIVQEAGAALKRTFAKMDEAPEIRERPEAAALAVDRGEIRFERVRFRYRDDVVALDGIDFVAPAAKTTALIGRSGSGKSTLLSLVPRLYDVTGGAVLIDGTDVRDATLGSLRANIAVVSQDVVLFDDTVRANIAFGRPGASDEAIVEAAKAAAAHEFIARLPRGLRGAGRPRRQPPVRRRAPAHRARPRLSQGRADPAPRRGDERARFGIRAPRPGGDRAADARPHDARHRAPAVDGARRRSHRGDGSGPHRRGRNARCADRPRRRLCPHAAPAGARRHSAGGVRRPTPGAGCGRARSRTRSSGGSRA